MSVFAGIFTSAGPASGVFGADSVYRAQVSRQAGAIPASSAEPLPSVPAKHSRKRKRAQLPVDEGASSHSQHGAASEDRHDKQNASPLPAATEPEPKSEAPAKNSRTGKERARTSKATAESIAERKADPERLARTVFIGNLLSSTSRKRLKSVFTKYGKVESVRLRSLALDPESKKPRRAAILAGDIQEGQSANAYVVFEKAESVEAALAHNMQLLDGRHVRVDKAAAHGERASVQYNPTRSVFVGNLAFNAQEEAVISFFTQGTSEPGLEQPVTAVRVVRDAATGTGKGFAFVEFRTKAAARTALGLQGQALEGRPVRVTRVSDRAPKGKAAVSGRLSKRGTTERPGPHMQLTPGRWKDGSFRKPSQPASAASAAWQGVRTKGAGKGPRSAPGTAPMHGADRRIRARSNTASGPSAPASQASSRHRSSAMHAGGKQKGKGKRPAVQARKAVAGT